MIMAEEKDRKEYPASLRVVVHAVTTDPIGFYTEIKAALKEIMKKDERLKDVRMVEENVRVLLNWGRLKKEIST